jgi:hypothetical protein
MKLEIEGMYHNIINTIFDKLRANIILNGEKLKPFPLKSGIRQGCPLSLIHRLGILSQSTKTGIRNKTFGTIKQIGKEVVKYPYL